MKSESVNFYHISAVSSQIHCVGVQKHNDRKKSIFVEIFVDLTLYNINILSSPTNTSVILELANIRFPLFFSRPLNPGTVYRFDLCPLVA